MFIVYCGSLAVIRRDATVARISSSLVLLRSEHVCDTVEVWHRRLLYNCVHVMHQGRRTELCHMMPETVTRVWPMIRWVHQLKHQKDYKGQLPQQLLASQLPSQHRTLLV